ncbi:TonB-dependent receptor [Algimonas ampicilliniresistens]|uniref:TonB-dependent receptor n=1 Tax=Algimonas ampicilliniresistens TaxID=1298735 RepID=A0ABQ5VC40_9PROT|nr:TonB-dependent receptor [Algimonas ampicilliniresistens]GLQ24542.1 TonB-dependent receptor [Algimonas ampicilliniresistens]
MRFAVIITAAIFAATSAYAQDPVVDEVTVTDQIMRVNDRPESIDIIPAEAARAFVHPAESLNAVAGVNIHRGSGQEHLTAIRSPVLTGGAGAGSFLFLENGIPLRSAGFANVNGLFEAGTEFAEQIEVFKGPGPTEYGSNAVHGLINIVTPEPGSGSTTTIIGSTRGYGRVIVGHDLTDDLRASISLAHDDGFRDESGFDQQKAELRYRTDFGVWAVDAIAAFNNLNQETAGFVQGTDAYVDDTLRFTNPNVEAFRDGKNYRAQVRLSRDLGEAELVMTPYARRAELRFLRHFVPGQALEKNGHTAFGVQTALIGDDWSVGVDGEWTDGFLYEFQDNPTRFSFVQGLHFDYHVKALVLAGYAQKSFEMDRLRLDVGARGEYTHYDYDTLAAPGVSGRFIRSPDRTDDFFTLTPKLGLTYVAADDITVFARAARGSRAPQTTDLYAVVQNQTPGEADVETLDSLEGGVRFGQGETRFEVTAYTMWKDNFFFRNAAGFNVVDGKTRHTGVEFSFAAPLTGWLSASGEWAVSDQSYAFNDASSGIRDGLAVDTAPNTLGTMRLNADWGHIGAGIEWRHVGRYYTNEANTQTYPGHDIFVARASYDVSDTVRVFGRVDNLFDTRYADRADFAFGNERYFPGRPRTLFVGLTANY